MTKKQQDGGALPYEPRDEVHFTRLGVACIEQHDLVVLADGERWRIVRLLAKRDANSNLRYACVSEDGDKAEVHSITAFVELLRPDITPKLAALMVDQDGFDFTVRNEGTVSTFEPHTDRARDWLKKHVQAESWQWLGGLLTVERRYSTDLLYGIINEGFTVAVNPT